MVLFEVVLLDIVGNEIRLCIYGNLDLCARGKAESEIASSGDISKKVNDEAKMVAIR